MMLPALVRSSLVLFLFSCSSITLVCLFDSAMANHPAPIMPSEKTTTIKISDQSQSSKNPSIETAEAWNNRLFGLYSIFLIAVGVLGTWFTVAVFKAGNKVQEAIKADADSRIEQLRVEGDKAQSELAKTNVRLTEAEGRLAEANRKAEEARRETAQASKDAALANERAGKVELETAKQRERAAKAENDLLVLQQRIAPRRLSQSQEFLLIEALKRSQVKGPVKIVAVLGDGEGLAFAAQLHNIIKAGDWPSNGVDQAAYDTNPIGMGILVRSAKNAPAHAGALQAAFGAAGISIIGSENPRIPAEAVELLVGNKPQ